MQSAFAVAAMLISLAFALSTFERWLARRRPHELTWSIALAMFVVAAGALAVGAGVGWVGATFRAFYLFGAILNVPFLALGTLYLLRGDDEGRRALVALLVFSAFATGVLVSAPFTAPLPRDELAQGADVFGALPRVLAAVASAGGAFVVLGGAVWSIGRRRGSVAANLLIAAGTLVLGGSGLLNSALDEMTAFAVTLVIGIALIFGGYLVATARTSRQLS